METLLMIAYILGLLYAPPGIVIYSHSGKLVSLYQTFLLKDYFKRTGINIHIAICHWMHFIMSHILSVDTLHSCFSCRDEHIQRQNIIP